LAYGGRGGDDESLDASEETLRLHHVLEPMQDREPRSLAKLNPRPKTVYCSQGRAVLATALDGMIDDYPRHGLFFAETRVLSRYQYFVEGKLPEAVAVSNVEQHSWLGYYICPPPGLVWKEDTGSGEMEEASEVTIELRVSRTVGLGVHEDLDFTNFSQTTTRFRFEIELDSDFADQAEAFRRKQFGRLRRRSLWFSNLLMLRPPVQCCFLVWSTQAQVHQ
jgi:N-terminal domain of (some) glycogen debranching enzymes